MICEVINAYLMGATPSSGISFVGSKTASSNGVGSLSVSLTDCKDTAGNNATLLQDDLVVVSYFVSAPSDVTQANMLAYDPTPAAYTAAHTDLYQNDTNDANLQVSYKFMGATPDTQFSINAPPNTGNARTVTVFVFRGVNLTTPLDATTATAGGIDTGVTNPPAITPVTAGALIMASGGNAQNSGVDYTIPADASAVTNHWRTVRVAPSARAAIGTALYTGWISGSFDPQAFGGGDTSLSASWAAVTLALKPA